MAEIFLARETGLAGFERLVVVKRVLPGLTEDMDFIDMFLDEARLAARLTHPNIVHIYELSEERGAYYIAMEYVPGGDLHELGGRRQGQLLPIADALYIISKVCAGLQFAHALAGPDGEPLGVVHRDVTPKNVLLSVDGVVKVVDFGIAKARAKLSITRPGDIKGTFSYMSPEQARGEQVDRRADVYAVGALTYRLVTGSPAYPQIGDSLLSAVRASQFVRPRKVNPNIPPQIEDIILRSMAFDPKDRYPTCGALRRDINDVMRQIGLHADAESIGQIVREGFPEVAGATASIDQPLLAQPPNSTEAPAHDALALAGPEESTGLVHLASDLQPRFDTDGEVGTLEDLAPLEDLSQLEDLAPLDLSDEDQTDMLLIPEELGAELLEDDEIEGPTRIVLPDALNRLHSTPRAVFGGDLEEPVTEPSITNFPMGSGHNSQEASPGPDPFAPAGFMDASTISDNDFVGPTPSQSPSGMSPPIGPTPPQQPSGMSPSPPPWSAPSGPMAVSEQVGVTPTATPILRNRRAKKKKKKSKRGLYLIIGGFTVGVFLITTALLLIVLPPPASSSGANPEPDATTVSPSTELLSASTNPNLDNPNLNSGTDPLGNPSELVTSDASLSSSSDAGLDSSLASTLSTDASGDQEATVSDMPPIKGSETEPSHPFPIRTKNEPRVVKTNSTRPRKDRPRTPRTEKSQTSSNSKRSVGYLTVFTVPSSRVFIGSKLLGNSPIAKREVPVGRYTLKLVSPDHPNKTVRVTVKSGKTTRVKQRL